jgi:hypothetical protein
MDRQGLAVWSEPKGRLVAAHSPAGPAGEKEAAWASWLGQGGGHLDGQLGGELSGERLCLGRRPACSGRQPAGDRGGGSLRGMGGDARQGEQVI